MFCNFCHSIIARPSATIAIAAIMALAGFDSRSQGAVVFSDNFSSSDINNATPLTPTSSATTYSLISTKTRVPTATIATGHLKFGIATTTSGVIEAQTRFSSSGVQLLNTGDNIEFTMTFTNQANILAQAMLFGAGLYNSAGVNPIAGGLNGTATSSTTAHLTDGTVGWQGYVTQTSFTGTNSRIMDRKTQTATGDQSQDVIGSGSGTSTYNAPSAGTIGSASAVPSVTLTNASQYTEYMVMTRQASGALLITTNLYAGANTSGTLLSTITGTTGITPLTYSYDSLGFGWRATANSTGGTVIDVNSISIVTNVPEPTALGLASMLGLALIRRKARNG